MVIKKYNNKTTAFFKTFLLFFSIIALFISPGVMALSQAQLNALNTGSDFLNTGCSFSSTGETIPTSTSSLASGSSVYILGDSITVRSESAYQSAFKAQGITANIDAQVGRSLDSPGTASENPGVSDLTSGFQAIADDKTEIQQASAIVIALGTNGGDTVQNIDQAISAIRADNSTAPIYWVDTIVVDNPSLVPTIEQSNEDIYSQSSAQGYQVISWFKTVDSNGSPTDVTTTETDTNGYIDDSDGLGVHPSAAGITALTNLVVSTVASGGGSSSSASGGADCSCSSSSSSATSVTITGNNVETAFDFFVQNGYSATQAAGIVGNLMYESAGTSGTINPTAVQVGGGGGYGIAQFTGVQLTDLETWAAAQGLDYTTLATQLSFLIYDLNTNYPTVVTALKQTTTIQGQQGSTAVFENQFENPQDPSQSLQARISDAEAAYNDYSGSSGSASGGTATASCESGTIDCTTVTGDAKILCEAQPFSGVYYEYGGGHQGFAAFETACPNPADPPDNEPTGGAVNGDPQGLSGNPSPCGVDCSALVSIATDLAFNQTFNWTVDNYQMQGAGSQYWLKIRMNQVQPGDIVTQEEHVEIVDSYNSSTGVLTTFGAHYTGVTDGTVTSTLSSWNDAYSYTGPGS